MSQKFVINKILVSFFFQINITEGSLKNIFFNTPFTNFAFMCNLPPFTKFAFMRNPHVYKH